MNFIRKLLATPGRGPSDWMCTYSGKQYFPAAPHPADVRLIDIAHHLSMICRFTGAVHTFYSVAEHSILVSKVVPPRLALLGLLHDAPEAYLTDLNRPTKRQCKDYQRLEALNWVAISEAFNLDPAISQGDWSVIHDADNAVLLAERDALMPLMPGHLMRDWPKGEAAKVVFAAMAPAQAKQAFLDRFNEVSPPRHHTRYEGDHLHDLVFV